MKKILFAVSALVLGASAALAQGEDYNRVGISYTNTHLGLNDGGKAVAAEWMDGEEGGKKIDGMSTNGISLDFTHGWGLSKSLPMYLEAGVRLGFSAGSKNILEESFNGSEIGPQFSQYYAKAKCDFQLQNLNLTIPVNFVWKFNVLDDITVAPYTGINFKFNLMTRGRGKGDLDANLPAEWASEDFETTTQWANLHSSKSIFNMMRNADAESSWDQEEIDETQQYADLLTMKRFQMGWQIGVGLQYQRYYLGLEYSLDFLPLYSHDWEDSIDVNVPGVGWMEVPVKNNARINTGTFRLSLAYCF